ncbi:MAG: hypothetical protein CMI53_04430 [Parcubacteria group bacterium]|nr:hypothetical protein [Parcubacteria group bacterium]|tara:strand:- start:16659 stop:17273 length:615 start_codon:yes stop_codon:yes gene_type:complete
MKSSLQVVVISVIFGLAAGLFGSYLVTQIQDQGQSKDNLIKEFYATETAVSVSPHHIRKGMDKGDSSFILVDLRSQEEYEREHIIGAISIPAYKDPETSAYGDVERIVRSFAELSKDKEIITYCYSIPCMTSRKVGNILAENGIFVKHLNVGWNEWRYFWTMWNHEHEWDVTNVKDYVISGSEPGTPKINEESKACPIEGGLGC